MDKKKFTSWGVSFGSLALVAGMVSYLGLSAKTVKANPTLQTPTTSQNANQPSQTIGGDNSQSSFDDNSSSDNSGLNSDNGSSATFGNDTQSSDNGLSSNTSPQDNGSFNGGSSGQQQGFDTTTGGT